MAIPSGTHLGPYEVLAPLGAGGMGEVYRARDTRLGREVAIKVLPAGLASDPERLKRFEREARSASALNHPNIVTIYDIGSVDSVSYIAMELVEGKTLREAMAGGALPVRKLLDIGIQIAEGLAIAHSANIVHRDLKPENVMVTKDGLVKILDFGLAKLAHPEFEGGQATQAPTISEGTRPGIVMGTVSYMSPEQASGHPVDFRSDQFAFGSILYEMATAKRAFSRSTAAQTMAAIIQDEPEPIAGLNPGVPPPLRWIVERCLAKEPQERFASTEDLARDLASLRDHISEVSGSVAVRTLEPLRRGLRVPPIFLAAVVLAALALGIALGLLRGRQASSPPPRFETSINPPAGTSFALDQGIAISPDGTHLVFATDDGHLWVHDLSHSGARQLTGAVHGSYPFWSPDSRSVAFFAQRKLKVIELSGGSVRTICDAPGEGRGGTWGREGVIVFAPGPSSPLFRVAASGGEPVPVTVLDATRKDSSHKWPWFLPDGRHFLYLAAPQSLGRENFPWVVAGSLDSKEATSLARAVSGPAYVPPDHLLYVRPGGTLVSQPFDERRLKTTGPAVPIAEQIEPEPVWWNSPVTFSLSGLLVYRSGPGSSSRLVWLDRAGKEVGSTGPAAEVLYARLSPDGLRAAVEVTDPLTGTVRIWIYDLSRGTAVPWTSDPADAVWPLWSSDGREIVFRSYREGSGNLFIGPSDGTAFARLFLHSPNEKSPTDSSYDGRWIVYDDYDPQTKADIWVLPLFGDRKPRPFLKTNSWEAAARFSPDGRWLAYESNQSGRFEVYATPFPGPGEKTQISTEGGRFPKWSRGGGEIVFLVGETQLMSAEIRTKPSLEVGISKPLFKTAGIMNVYEPSPDSQRFLLVVADKAFRPPPLTVVQNWMAELKER